MSATIPTGTELRRAALERVKGYVCKDRQATHGDAEDNFRQIAAYWALYKGYPFTPGDVAAMMALVKIARMKTSPDYVDNWDDLAGYAICGAGLAEAKRLREVPEKPVTSDWTCSICKRQFASSVVPGIIEYTPAMDKIFTCTPCVR